MHFLLPNQQCQTAEGVHSKWVLDMLVPVVNYWSISTTALQVIGCSVCWYYWRWWWNLVQKFIIFVSFDEWICSNHLQLSFSLYIPCSLPSWRPVNLTVVLNISSSLVLAWRSEFIYTELIANICRNYLTAALCQNCHRETVTIAINVKSRI